MEVKYLGPPRYLGPRENFVPGSHENWVGYYPGAIRTRHNNTQENCILNLQDDVQQNLCFISFFDTSLFAVVLNQLNGFFLHIVRVHIWYLQFPPCWLSCANIGHAHYSRSCAGPPEIFWCRALTWIIVVPVNRVTRVVQARYLGPPSYPVWCERTSYQNRETRAHLDISGARDIPAPRDISPHVNRLL